MNYCKECITKKPKQTVEECSECKQNMLLVENGIEYRVDPDILNDFPEIMKCNVFPNWRTT